MFSVNQYGRLEYAPFRRFHLPELVRVYDEWQREHFDRGEPVDVAITARDGRLIRSLPLYRLQWPGAGLYWRFSNLGHSRIQDAYPDIQEAYEAYRARQSPNADEVTPENVVSSPVPPQMEEPEPEPEEPSEPDELLDLRRGMREA